MAPLSVAFYCHDDVFSVETDFHDTFCFLKKTQTAVGDATIFATEAWLWIQLPVG
jgi:hypothetical protein